MSFADKAAVTGIGETLYTRGSGKTPFQLAIEASLEAIADAGLTPKDIDGVIPVGLNPAPVEEYIVNFDLPDLRFSPYIALGGASPVVAVQCAAAAIAAGVASNILIPVGRNGFSGQRAGVRIHEMPQFHFVSEYELPIGAIAPAQLYAPMARRHMELYGTTSRQLGEIAVAVRAHACLNDNAIMKKPITLEDHQNSRLIADPLRLFDCSLESDGGAALVISSAERARDGRRPPILISGAAEGHPDQPGAISQRKDITRLGLAKAAPRAFQMAGVTPADIDVAEVYDCFTYIVLCQLEDMGFCKKGEGGSFVENGRLRLGGALPTNTHGGLLSQAHMLGMNHVVELARQLRHEGGRRQVKDAEVGLATGYGDQGDGAIVIMRRG